MKATLPSGTVLDGTPEEIMAVVAFGSTPPIVPKSRPVEARRPDDRKAVAKRAQKRAASKAKRRPQPGDLRGHHFHTGQRHPDVLRAEALARSIIDDLGVGEECVVSEPRFNQTNLVSNINKRLQGFSDLPADREYRAYSRRDGDGTDLRGRKTYVVHVKRTA